MSAQDIFMEASSVTYGAATAQVQTITTVADSSGSLNSTYFFLYAADGTKRYVWLNVNTAGVDPTPAGFIEVEVALATSATAAAIATALQTAIDGLDDFTATVSGNVVTVTDVTTGYASAMHNSSAASPGFAYSVSTLGDSELELGCLEGDIEIAWNPSYVDVQCHESGVTSVASFQNGYNEVTVNLTMLETTAAKLKQVLMKSQGSMTPIGASGTEVMGIGTFNDFKNVLNFASKLVIHPKRLLAADKSRDVCAWKAYPVIENRIHSAEGPLKIPLTFKCYPDSTKSTRANIVAFGDHSQSVVGG